MQQLHGWVSALVQEHVPVNMYGELTRNAVTTWKQRGIVVIAMGLLVLAGCVSVDKDVAHFEPVPREEVGVAELDPVEPEGAGRMRLGVSHSDHYSDLHIPYPLPQPILDELDELQNSYPRTFQRGLNRSARYMPHLQKEFRNAGLPEDLAWLAMVESMFQPRVVSPAGAGGMWQFMRATGRRYNLRMDSFVDERYNWHSATRAAIAYLQTLHDFFDGDWSLAITAYNMGEGGLSRAIASNGGERDFFTLINTPPASNRIRQETKKFYPRVMAYIIAARDPEKYGFEYEPEPFEDVLRMPVKGMYNLSDLDDALGLSRGTLARLNPDLLREVTPPQGEYPVAVPREHRARFMAALESVPSVRHAGTHRVRRGETISQIAQRYGVCGRELMRINNIRSARSLQINQELQLPGTAVARGGGESAPADQPQATQTASATTRQRNYTVRRGDTLYDIARAHNVSVANLQQWNNLGGRTRIRIGQTLNVGAAPAAAPAGPVRRHTVKPGEYPGIIAQLYGIPVNDLLRWNNLSRNSVIRAGDTLIVAQEAAPADTRDTVAKPEEAPAAPTVVTHAVAPGETAGGIAARYGVPTRDLLAWNNLTAKSIIRVGQELEVRNPGKGAPQRNRGGDVQVAQAQDNKQVTHKVTAGQNPTTIARQYGVRVQDLFEWNNWSDSHVLQIGDEVAIYRD